MSLPIQTQPEHNADANRSRQLPLTFQQAWLWSLSRQYPDWNCTVTETFRLKGPLEISVLQRSLDETYRRHGSLRTRIVVVDGVGLQQIDPPQGCRIESVAITGSGIALEACAQRTVEEFADLRIDPLTDPLVRIRLLRLSPDEHWLVLAMHRLIGDCASIGQAVREIWALHDEWAEGTRSDFPGDPPQYTDYAQWQQQTRGQWLARHQTYWNDRLAGALPLRWPRRDATSETDRKSLGKLQCHFGDRLSKEVHKLARTVKTLPGTVMLAVYVAVLSRWCRQRSFVLPFVVAGRPSEYRRTIGNFSHVLYLRFDLAENESFVTLSSRVSNEFYRASSHQDFGQMAAAKPALLDGTLFQWVTWHPDDALRPYRAAAHEARQVTAERIPIRDFADGLTAIPPGRVDVEMTFFDTATEIYAAATYRADHFRPQTMECFMQDLLSTTEQFICDPHAHILTQTTTPAAIP